MSQIAYIELSQKKIGGRGMQKKYLLLIMLSVLSILTLLSQTGGFTGPRLEVITVEQAKSLKDDTPVVMHGKIIESLGNEYYTFADETGSIRVEIDNDVWKGLFVSENDLVEIHGEIEKDWLRIKISVDSIKKITNP